MMKNKIISIVLLLCAIVCTAIIYHLIFNEHNTLFYFNVVTACVTEIILFLNIPILSDKKLLTFKNAASTTLLNIYAIALFLWTTICSLYIENEDNYKILYIGILAVTIVFAFLLGSVELGGNIMQKEEKKINQSIQVRKELNAFLEMYRMEIKDIYENIPYEPEDKNFHLLETILDKISIFPIEKLNQDTIIDIKGKLDEIKKLLKELCETKQKDIIESQMIRNIKNLNNYINTLKSTL